MSNIVDTRGLLCPQPVMETLEEMGRIKKGQIEVLVDTDTSRENVMRAAKSQGWEVKEIKPEGTGFRITIANAIAKD